jgi:hypothetical protein
VTGLLQATTATTIPTARPTLECSSRFPYRVKYLSGVCWTAAQETTLSKYPNPFEKGKKWK